MLQTTRWFMPICNKLLYFYFLVSILPLAHRYSANETTGKEQTFAMIKPDGVSGNYANAIKKIILDSGFSITKEVLVQLDEDTVRNFYAEHSQKIFFLSLVQYMISGPVLIMVLEKVNAIADWCALIGPTDPDLAKVTHPQSIRAMCGLDLQRNCVHGQFPLNLLLETSFFTTKSSTGQLKLTHPQSIRAMCGLDLQRNCVHGSDSPQSAARDIIFHYKVINRIYFKA